MQAFVEKVTGGAGLEGLRTRATERVGSAALNIVADSVRTVPSSDGGEATRITLIWDELKSTIDLTGGVTPGEFMAGAMRGKGLYIFDGYVDGTVVPVPEDTAPDPSNIGHPEADAFMTFVRTLLRATSTPAAWKDALYNAGNVGGVWNRIKWRNHTPDIGADIHSTQEHYDRVHALLTDPANGILGKKSLYSCGLWLPDTTTVDEADNNKLGRSEEYMGLKKDQPAYILEPGAGMGANAQWMLDRYPKTRMMLLTTSGNHRDHLQEMFAGSQYESRVDIQLQHWREHLKDVVDEHGQAGVYDRIVSHEMVEHVPAPELQDFFDAHEIMLKPGGEIVIQSIQAKDNHLQAQLAGADTDYIRQRAFLRGNFHSDGTIRKAAKNIGMTIRDVTNFQDSYALHLGRGWLRNALDELEGKVEPRMMRKIIAYLGSMSASFYERVSDDNMYRIVPDR